MRCGALEREKWAHQVGVYNVVFRPNKDLLKTYNTPPTDVHTIILMCKELRPELAQERLQSDPLHILRKCEPGRLLQQHLFIM